MNQHVPSLLAKILFVILTVTSAYANDISYTYDQLNRLTGVVYADGTTIEYSYDELGNRITQNVSSGSDLKARFSASPTSGPAPLDVTFTDQSTGTVSARSWDFGDGGSSSIPNPSHTYSSAGTYTVTLAVTGGGQSSSQSATITVNSGGPRADFSASPTGGSAPLSVQFTDNSTGDVTTWSWSFGDGGTSSGQNPSHTYTSAGTYTPTLTVTGPGGTSGPKSTTITVNPPAPRADFSAAPNVGTAPLTVSFSNTSTGIITSWFWDFGDGATGNSENPTHTYTVPGTYTATLTVGGPNGYSSSKSAFVTVNAVIPPVANFAANPVSGAAPLTVSFTDSSTGTITGRAWDFGDGTMSSSLNPTHSYTGAGVFTVTLSVVGPTGLSDAKSISITVNPAEPPIADFGATPTIGEAPFVVQFTDASTGSISTWFWDFGDGRTSTSQSPSHVYFTPGSYMVSLTVTGPGGSNAVSRANYISATAGVDQYTKLLLHLNGATGSRTFIDSEEIPKTVTGYGNAQITTAYSKFGGGSLQLDGNGSCLSAGPSPEWDFSGDFTIDFWWYRIGGSYTYSPVISVGTSGYSFLIGDWGGTVYLWMSSNGTSWDIANQVSMGTPSGMEFEHFALVRAGDTYYTFKNGAFTNSFVNLALPYYNPLDSLNIGGPWNGHHATGYLDEVRISKGVARWTWNFAPPSSPYTEGVVTPTAGFSASPTSGPAELPVQFTDTSTGSVTGWSWDFGDGATSTGQYPTHIYSTPGTYTVSLTTTGHGGSDTSTQTNLITVVVPSLGVDQYTKLLLHLNGANGGRTFIDSEEIPKTVTGYGNAQTSTVYSKFGGGSLKLDGNSSYLSLASSPDWDLSGDFTIDFWWYRTGGTYSCSALVTATSDYSFLIRDWGETVSLWISSNGTSWDIANQVSMGTSSGTGFDHFALVRAGNTYHTFKNGALTNSILNPLPPYHGASAGLYFGRAWNGCYALGYLDEVRISKGVVRWLSNFTPPSSPYTDGAIPPTAGFSASPTSGPAPLWVQFTDTSEGSITSWSWDFGDGNTRRLSENR